MIFHTIEQHHDQESATYTNTRWFRNLRTVYPEIRGKEMGSQYDNDAYVERRVKEVCFHLEGLVGTKVYFTKMPQPAYLIDMYFELPDEEAVAFLLKWG